MYFPVIYFIQRCCFSINYPRIYGSYNASEPLPRPLCKQLTRFEFHFPKQSMQYHYLFLTNCTTEKKMIHIPNIVSVYSPPSFWKYQVQPFILIRNASHGSLSEKKKMILYSLSRSRYSCGVILWPSIFVIIRKSVRLILNTFFPVAFYVTTKRALRSSKKRIVFSSTVAAAKFFCSIWYGR